MDHGGHGKHRRTAHLSVPGIARNVQIGLKSLPVTRKAPPVLLALVLLSTAPLARERAANAAEAEAAPPTSDEGAASPDVATQTKLKTEKHEDTSAPPTDKEKPDQPKKEDKESGEDDTYGHFMQFGIRAGIDLGYKMIFRYPHSPLCTPYDPAKAVHEQQKVCGFGAPAGTEVAISFGVLDSVEPYIFGRFGFSKESKTNTKPLQQFGLGARLYTMSDSRLKIFIEPALAYETEGGAGDARWAPGDLNPAYKKDLIFHLGIGPQYDVAKAFGIFLNGGVDVGVLRAISATLLINIGAQLRFL